ncbi:MAG: SUMF1/EgtB/PvdO family nonheme iron enzyme [Myxococcota bacterium]
MLGKVELSELPRPRTGESVFVCYSRMDRVLVGRLVEQLRTKGIVTRWDGDIPGGDDFQETIGQWIEDAALVVALLTEHSVVSSRVKDEVSLARHYSCHRLPLRVGDVQLPPGLHLDLVRTNMESFPSSVGARELADAVEQVLMTLNVRLALESTVPHRGPIVDVRSQRSMLDTVPKHVSLRAAMVAFIVGMVVCALLMSRGARTQGPFDGVVAVTKAVSSGRSGTLRDNQAGTCPEGTRFIRGGSLYGHWLSGFCMDRTEVTVEAFCSAGNRAARSEGCDVGRIVRVAHPMMEVSWSEAKQYCEAPGGRLPTEEQWEWAARGREQGRIYPWGNDGPTYDLVVMTSRSFPSEADTRPVGSMPAGMSRDGLFDMAGNVGEWTDSSTEEGLRIVRGGSWMNVDASTFSTSARLALAPQTSSDRVGFRCVQDPVMR